MLDNLLEIEVAYNLLQTSEGGDKDKDAVDAHYEKLKTDIKVNDGVTVTQSSRVPSKIYNHSQVLERDSNEFKILSKYVKNTHASTHNLYKLKIEEIFKISRHGEAKRFEKFKSLDNRMLLWHGSRTTNYAGILSQVIKIDCAFVVGMSPAYW